MVVIHWSWKWPTVMTTFALLILLLPVVIVVRRSFMTATILLPTLIQTAPQTSKDRLRLIDQINQHGWIFKVLAMGTEEFVCLLIMVILLLSLVTDQMVLVWTKYGHWEQMIEILDHLLLDGKTPHYLQMIGRQLEQKFFS